MLATRWFLAATMVALLSVLVSAAHAQSVDVAKLAQKVKAVDVEGKGHAAAVAAAAALQKADAKQLPEILAAMDGANPLAINWLRGCVEAVAGKAEGNIPQKEVEKFLLEVKHHPRARRLAYEVLASVDPDAGSRLIPQMLDDPSLELRRDAVALEINKAEALAASDKAAAAEAFAKTFTKARDLDQIQTIATKAKELGGESFAPRVDIAKHMGFVMSWQIIGPFENGADKGWDVAYEPEKIFDPAAKYTGQKGEVAWLAHTTTNELGAVDLNKFLDKHKGAIAYAAATVVSPRAREVEVRYGCINATKLWVNGEFVTANHVYHAGMQPDQYVAKVKLKEGNNVILLKVAQNEQTEAWAQEWSYQLRVCDEIGTPVVTQVDGKSASRGAPANSLISQAK